jgi:hypothetical protein
LVSLTLNVTGRLPDGVFMQSIEPPSQLTGQQISSITMQFGKGTSVFVLNPKQSAQAKAATTGIFKNFIELNDLKKW